MICDVKLVRWLDWIAEFISWREVGYFLLTPLQKNISGPSLTCLMGTRGFYIELKVAMIFIYHLSPFSAEVKNAVVPYSHLHGVVCRDPSLHLPDQGKDIHIILYM